MINANYNNKQNIGLNFGCLTIFIAGCGFYFYKKYCQQITFDTIEKKFKNKHEWEKELEIYEISMPKFYTKFPKKDKCILFIGGYKDIPYVWKDIENLFILDKIDFFAPRTHGNGRKFFQIVNWKDWIITYLEAIYILQEQYNSIDIISFSTGTVIALYLTQYEYKCKINNVFLCAPFLLYKPFLSIDLFFGSNIFSYLLNRICAWTLRFHFKSKSKFAGYRDTNYDFNSINDFCEIIGDLEMETVLFNFVKFRPKKIIASNVVILYPNDDEIIGNINLQHKIISDIYSKSIDLISIPSYLNNDYIDTDTDTNQTDLPIKCGHVMFKEHPNIVQDIYNNLKKYMM